MITLPHDFKHLTVDFYENPTGVTHKFLTPIKDPTYSNKLLEYWNKFFHNNNLCKDCEDDEVANELEQYNYKNEKKKKVISFIEFFGGLPPSFNLLTSPEYNLLADLKTLIKENFILLFLEEFYKNIKLYNPEEVKNFNYDDYSPIQIIDKKTLQIIIFSKLKRNCSLIFDAFIWYDYSQNTQKYTPTEKYIRTFNINTETMKQLNELMENN